MGDVERQGEIEIVGLRWRLNWEAVGKRGIEGMEKVGMENKVEKKLKGPYYHDHKLSQFKA